MKASNTESIDTFGAGAVALSEDRLAVGASREASCATDINGNQSDNSCSLSGAVYVFARETGRWSQQAYVKAPNTEGGDAFGPVAITNDRLAVGAPGESSCASGIDGNQQDNGCLGAGAAYVYVAR